MKKKTIVDYNKLYEKTYNCPVCGSIDKFNYCCYKEECYGIVEQHGYCDNCGLVIEQAYSDTATAFRDISKGFRGYDGQYHAKNIKRHRKVRKKLGINNSNVNPMWVWMV